MIYATRDTFGGTLIHAHLGWMPGERKMKSRRGWKGWEEEKRQGTETESNKSTAQKDSTVVVCRFVAVSLSFVGR